MTPDDLATAPEALVQRLAVDRPAATAALALAELARQAAIELHKLARAEANARRGQADWGAWAKLANAARTALLQTTTCRDAARDLEQPTG